MRTDTHTQIHTDADERLTPVTLVSVSKYEIKQELLLYRKVNNDRMMPFLNDRLLKFILQLQLAITLILLPMQLFNQIDWNTEQYTLTFMLSFCY